jgi:nucleotide-binding universal stress UspA family protein
VAAVIIVVGVDDSDRSRVAARKACRLGSMLDAEVHAVFVTHMPATMLAALAGSVSATSDFAEAQRRAVWETIRPVLDASDAATEVVDLEGYPADTLIDYAEEVGASLVVVGSRGRGDLAALVLGSTSHRVVNHAPCDVLVARGD